MATMDTRLSLIESRSATMEERGRGGVGLSELGGNPIDSNDTFSDQNLDPNLQFQRQESRFRHQDSQFQFCQPPIKLDFPRFVDGDDPLAWVYKAEHFFLLFFGGRRS